MRGSWFSIKLAAIGASWIAGVLIAVNCGATVRVATTQPISGVLMDAGGRALGGVTVVAIADGRWERITDGKLLIDGDARAATSDSSGHFAFGPATRPVGSVLAVTAAGLAIAYAGDFSANFPLRAVPYCQVRGTLHVRQHVGSGKLVSGVSEVSDEDMVNGGADFVSTARTDADGKFRLSAVRGQELIIESILGDAPDQVSRTVTITAPSEGPVQQDVGGSGRLVTFRVIAPAGFKIVRGSVYVTPVEAKFVMPSPDWPAESVHWNQAKQAAFYDEWRSSPRGKALLQHSDAYFRARDAKYFYGYFNADGLVQLEDVLPCKRNLAVYCRGVDAGGETRTLEIEQELTVDSAPAGKPDVAQAYGGFSIPTMVLIGTDGKVLLSTYRSEEVMPAIAHTLGEEN